MNAIFELRGWLNIVPRLLLIPDLTFKTLERFGQLPVFSRSRQSFNDQRRATAVTWTRSSGTS